MRKQSEIIDVLAEVPLFSRCSKKDLQALARRVDVLSFEEGQTIVRQGGVGNAFYVLLDGFAAVRRSGRRVGRLGPGEYFGELALLDPGPRNADIEALSPVTVARLVARDFNEVLHSVPAISERLLAGLARRLREEDRRSVQ
jgi:CRP-like cAMP-binding protein